MIKMQHQIRSQFESVIITHCGRKIRADQISTGGDHCMRCLYALKLEKGAVFMRSKNLPVVEREMYGEYGRGRYVIK